MKKIPKIIVWIGVTLVAIHLFLIVAVALFGKTILISRVEKSLKRQVALESLRIGFPLSINLRKLDIPGLVKIESLTIRPSLLGFLAGKIIFSEVKIVRPQLTLEKGRDGRLNLASSNTESSAKSNRPPFLLTALDIKEGEIVFIDRKVDPSGYKMQVKRINAHISKVSFPPTSLLTRFELSSFLGKSQDSSKGGLSASGWIDFRPKDMEGEIKLKDIDLTYFTPYFQKALKGRRMVSGKANLTSDLKAINNNLEAKCLLALSDLVYKQEKPEEEQSSLNLIPDVMGIFFNATNKASFNFTIRTKLDKPVINLGGLKKAAAITAMKNVIAQPPEKIIEKVKDIGEQFEDFGKEIKDIFKKKYDQEVNTEDGG